MLLERDDLLAKLDDALRSAADRRGTLVLLSGEAGAGKTSVIRAFAGTVDGRARTLIGGCDPLATPRPLSPLHDVATELGSGLVDLLNCNEEPTRIFAEVVDQLRSPLRPTVLVIEDLHWADQGTLDLIRYLGRRVGDTGSVVILTYRDDEVGSDHPLRSVVGHLGRLESCVRIAVPPLSESAVANLAKDTAVDPAELYEVTGGNAFFVTEVIAGDGGMPRSVGDAVIARLLPLGDGPRRVVETAAVAPRSLAVRDAVALAGGAARDVDMALASGVIEPDPGGLRFRHELARSAVEASIPPARRQRLHASMVELLLQDTPPDHARIVHHAIGADRPSLVVSHAPDAIADAAARHSLREAAAFSRAALEHSHLIEPASAAAMQVELARYLRHLDRPEEARQAVGPAIDHYRAEGKPSELAAALIELSSSLWYLNRMGESREALDEAISILRDTGVSEMLGMALYRSAHTYMLERRAAPSRAAAAEAMAVAKRVGSDRVHWLADVIDACVETAMGEAGAGLARLESAYRVAEAAGDTERMSLALSMLGSGGGEVRHYEAAEQNLERHMKLASRLDHDMSLLYSMAWHARVLFEQGRWGEAAVAAEAVERGSERSVGIAMLTAQGTLGRLRVRRGDPGGRQLLERALEGGRDSELQHRWAPLCGLAEYHWLRGETDAMVDLLDRPYGRALATDSPWAKGELGFWMWLAGAIDRPSDGAAEPFALQIGGEWSAAAERWLELGCPYEAGLALADGDDAALLESITIFDKLGARPMADRVRQRMRAAGAPSVPRGPIRSTAKNPFGLTNRQLEVWGLMKEGRTNGEIAATLYVSKKTVEHHVSAVFTKLGVTSRADAIAIRDQPAM